LSDHWIISRFNRTVAECNSALNDYRFDHYAKACYDFFWRDLCDWYLEAIKPAMKDPARAAGTANVLASVLDGALRLMHPMTPFITETIWWKLNDVRPDRSIAGHLECPPSQRLIKAAWPVAAAVDDAIEAVFASLQETIGAIRNLRNEHKVDPKRVVTATIVAPAESARQIEENREIIELLALCKLAAVGPNLAPPAQAARTQASSVEIYLEGLVDQAAEQQRSTKRKEELTKKRTALQGRLANKAYADRAPAHLVQQTRDELAAVEAELEKLG
jgi:valyl-tRNA synthetase